MPTSGKQNRSNNMTTTTVTTATVREFDADKLREAVDDSVGETRDAYARALRGFQRAKTDRRDVHRMRLAVAREAKNLAEYAHIIVSQDWWLGSKSDEAARMLHTVAVVGSGVSLTTLHIDRIVQGRAGLSPNTKHVAVLDVMRLELEQMGELAAQLYQYRQELARIQRELRAASVAARN